MFRLWRHGEIVFDGGWIGLIDYIKSHLTDSYYLAMISRDLDCFRDYDRPDMFEHTNLVQILTESEWASVEYIEPTEIQAAINYAYDLKNRAAIVRALRRV